MFGSFGSGFTLYGSPRLSAEANGAAEPFLPSGIVAAERVQLRTLRVLHPVLAGKAQEPVYFCGRGRCPRGFAFCLPARFVFLGLCLARGEINWGWGRGGSKPVQFIVPWVVPWVDIRAFARTAPGLQCLMR